MRGVIAAGESTDSGGWEPTCCVRVIGNADGRDLARRSMLPPPSPASSPKLASSISAAAAWPRFTTRRAGESTVYDFFSAMPGLGRAGLARGPLDFEAVSIDYGATTQTFYLGRGAVAVPGNIFGLCRLAADHGRLPLATLLQPAIALAQDGALLDQFQADTCELLRPLYTHTAGMRAIFAPEGQMIRAGERVTIPHLVETLTALAAQGEQLLRRGGLAQALLEDQAERGGLLTAEDLATYTVQRQPPIRVAYREFEVLLPPPPSSGGVLTAFALRLLAHFPVSSLHWNGARHLQLLYEVMAATMRARAELGAACRY
jgi:gamma-glutamyltranspeptidase / glutathione hydrolase